MAKMFYTRSEVQQKLGLTEEQVKQLVMEGHLREFHDNANVMYKVDEVDNLDLSGAVGAIDSPSDSSDPLSLSGSDFDLAPTEPENKPEPLPGDAMGSTTGRKSESGDQISLEDSKAAGSGKDDTVITSHGAKVLDDSDELTLVDPLAQTQLAQDLEGMELDSGSSGSGLLDLSREADDTSLGAELLEEIYPGSDEEALETQLPTQLDMPSTSETTGIGELRASMPMTVYAQAEEVYDPTSAAFGVMLIVPFVVLVYLAFVTSASIAEVQPKLLQGIGSIIWYVMGGAVVVALGIGLVGNFITGKQGQADKPKKEKAPKEKAQKEKAKKEK